jgi:hypothetical protein
MSEEAKEPDTPPAKKPASFRQAFAMVEDIRSNALALRKNKFPDQTPEPLIFIFAQCKRLKEVLRALEKPDRLEKEG